MTIKLENKETGEIGELCGVNWITVYVDNIPKYKYETLAQLSEEWEDYEEPIVDDFWFIDLDGEIQDSGAIYEDTPIEGMKQIGNYFETKEEAEQAVKKLKAWRRLKDRGVTFEIKCINRKEVIVPMAEEETTTFSDAARAAEDLELIFGGEE